MARIAAGHGAFQLKRSASTLEHVPKKLLDFFDI
jgi:hypothetical protein